MNIPTKFKRLNISKQDSGLRKIYCKHFDRGKPQRFLDSINKNPLFLMNSSGITDTEFYFLEYYEITNGQDLIFFMTWTALQIYYIYNFNIYVNETLYKSYEVKQNASGTQLYIDLPQIKENQNYYFELKEIGTYELDSN